MSQPSMEEFEAELREFIRAKWPSSSLKLHGNLGYWTCLIKLNESAHILSSGSRSWGYSAALVFGSRYLVPDQKHVLTVRVEYQDGWQSAFDKLALEIHKITQGLLPI